MRNDIAHSIRDNLSDYFNGRFMEKTNLLITFDRL